MTIETLTSDGVTAVVIDSPPVSAWHAVILAIA
jgi:hypothetical protein